MVPIELEYLREELKILADAASILEYSFQLCGKIGIKNEYTLDDMDRFEALTSRFARMNDILVQKVLRAIDELDLENGGTVRDRIHRAEKKGLIFSSEDFVEMRVLRNDIAHEYLPSAVKDIYIKVLEYTPKLLESVEKVKNYCKKYDKSEI